MRDRTQETVTMIQGICFGIVLMAFLVVFYTLPRAKREAFRVGTESFLVYMDYYISTRDTTRTHPIYYTDDQIDSTLEASK